MEFKNVYIENNIKDELKRKCGSKRIKKHNIVLNDFNHIFYQIRYYNENGKYIKTLNIIEINGILLEDDDFYVSFTKQSKDLLSSDPRKFSYGLFTKRDIIDQNQDKGLICFYGKQIDKIYDVDDNRYIIFYTPEFLKRYKNYPFIGIDTKPRTEHLTKSFASFVNKTNDGNCFIYQYVEIKKITEVLTFPRPTFCLRNKSIINEDDEITWDINYKM